MKTNLGYEKKKGGRALGSFTLGYERLVRRVQSQIFQARAQGKTADVHALQKDLCESFCAKLLATDYAISNERAKRVRTQTKFVLEKLSDNTENSICACSRKAQLFAPFTDTNAISTTFTRARENVKSKRCFVSPLLDGRGSLQRKEAVNSKQSFCESCALFVPQSLRISIAQSLWFDTKANKLTYCRLSRSKTFKRRSHEHENTCALKNTGKVVKEKRSKKLKRLAESKLRGIAEQIHALLALEPEWQAVFALRDTRGNKKLALRFLCGILPSFHTGGKKVNLQVEERSQRESRYNNQQGVGTKQNFVPPHCQQKFVCAHNRCMHRHSLCKRCHKVTTPQAVIKQIKEQLSSPFSKHVFTISIKGWLHLINHQTLIDKLNTFPAMQKRICTLLKTGVLQTNQIASRIADKDAFSTKYANLWQSPLRKAESRSYDFPRLSTEDSLYSLFPHILLKRSDYNYDTMQIENYVGSIHHVITPLLVCIILHSLQERIQGVSSTTKTTLTGVQTTLAGTKSTSTSSCITNGEHPPFCSGYEDHLIIIHSKKEILEKCVLQVKHYLSEITTVNFELDAICSLKKQDRQEANQAKPCSFTYKRFSAINHNSCKREKNIRCNANLSAFHLSREGGIFSLTRKLGPCFDFSRQKKTAKLCCQTQQCANVGIDVTPRFEEFAKIQDCRQGFSFLDFQIIQKRKQDIYVCTVTPSRKSVRSLLLLVTNQIKQNRSVSATVLVSKLNCLLLRWVEYYKDCEYKRPYKQILYLLFEKIRPWLSRRKLK